MRVFEFVQGVELRAQLFGKVVVQFGQGLLLHALHPHGIAESLSRKPFIIGISGINHIKGPLLARRRSVQVLVEFGDRILAANFDQDLVHVDGLAFAIFGLAIERCLGEVAFLQRTAFDGGVGGLLLAQTVERLLHFLVGDGDLFLLGAQLLIALDLYFGMTSKLALKRSGSLSCTCRSLTWGCETGAAPAWWPPGGSSAAPGPRPHRSSDLP